MAKEPKELTIKKLKKMKEGIFASGETEWEEHPIKWVATRGGIHDWAIYYMAKPIVDEDEIIEVSEERIRDWGDKLYNQDKIRELVPCNDEAFNMYRY